ncbi:MAG: hypothetical protein AB1546_02290 [bacterium]
MAELSTQERVLQLIIPITVGEKYFEDWVMSSIETPELDVPKIIFRLKNEETGKEVSLEMSTRNPEQPCYDCSRSFSFAFAAEGESTLTLDEEKAMVAVIDTIIKNDKGRLEIQHDENKKVQITELPVPPGLWQRIISRIKK